jgi:hypothetical protein
MRFGVIPFLVGIFLLGSCSSLWAQEHNRVLVVEQALDDFDKKDSSGRREETIQKALEAFEMSHMAVAESDEESLTARDMKIIKALQRLEQAQVQPPNEFPEIDVVPEKIRVKPPMTLRGQLRSEVAARLYSPSQLTKFKNQLSLTATGELVPSIRYRISGRAHYDAAYDIEDSYSDSAKSDQRLEAELRETYIDYSLGDWDFRLGKQQVVWGEAIALFVADVVNGKDLREFILPDFDSIRIPEWGLNAEYTNDNFNSQFILLPGIELDKYGVTGSEFAFPLPLPPQTPATYSDAKSPKDGLENSKIGTRLNYLWEGVDMGVFYLHSWTPTPVLYRSIDAGVYNFTPDYRRLDTFGATVSKEINDIVFKGDFVYTKDDFFPVIDPADGDGIARSGRFDYLLGADYTFFDRIDVNAQFSQRIVQDFQDTMVFEEKYANSFSLRLSRQFLNRRLLAEFLTVYGTRGPDFLYRPKLRYNLSDNWQVSLGADVFSGHRIGTFGYFRNQSRIYSELSYKF